MTKLILNIILLGALLLASVGCGSKTSKKEAVTEQQGSQFKKAEELIMQEFNARFSKSGDDLYTARLEEENLYIQVKKPNIVLRSHMLDEADRLNGITWSAYYSVEISSYRIAPAKGSPNWGKWCSGGSGIKSPMRVHLVEQEGKLKVESIEGIISHEGDYLLLRAAKRVDVLPDSLKDPGSR